MLYKGLLTVYKKQKLLTLSYYKHIIDVDPQESIHGPLLLILFVNKVIPFILPNIKINLCVDDTTNSFLLRILGHCML